MEIGTGARRVLCLGIAAAISLGLFTSPAAGWSLLGPGAAGKGGKAVRLMARGSNGFAVSVYAPVGPRSPVAITVESGRGAAQYVATGVVTTTRVRASFGRYGRISMRFRPSGTLKRAGVQLTKGCPDGAAALVGTFVGTFRFDGEGGYTKVAAHRVDGGVGAPTAPFDQLETKQFGCHQEQHLAEPILPASPTLPGSTKATVPGGLSLFASAATTTGTIHLSCGPVLVNGSPAEPPTSAIAVLLQEEVEGVRIGRFVLGGGATSQVFPGNPSPATGATLTPGAPFQGSATYAPGSSGIGTLSGDLSVPMPGAGTVPLAGPSFGAELLRPET